MHVQRFRIKTEQLNFYEGTCNSHTDINLVCYFSSRSHSSERIQDVNGGECVYIATNGDVRQAGLIQQ